MNGEGPGRRQNYKKQQMQELRFSFQRNLRLWSARVLINSKGVSRNVPISVLQPVPIDPNSFAISHIKSPCRNSLNPEMRPRRSGPADPVVSVLTNLHHSRPEQGSF